jgi:hypothetical protein
MAQLPPPAALLQRERRVPRIHLPLCVVVVTC